MNRALPLLLMLTLPMAAQAKVYRWVDAQGQVHYSQTPPPQLGAEPQSLKSVPGSPSPAAPSAAPAAKPAAPAAASAPPKDDKAEREARAKRCTEARERISFLEEKTARRLGTEQPDGTLSRMTEEEFEERLGKARAEASKSCGS